MTDQLPAPDRGEVWLVDLDPIIGREQGLTRWTVVISDSTFNHGPADLVTIVPATRTLRKLRMRVRVIPPEGGFTDESDILVDQVRTVSKMRLRKSLGRVSPATMAAIEDRLRMLLVL
jgi:mRNA interferase MazF